MRSSPGIVPCLVKRLQVPGSWAAQMSRQILLYAHTTHTRHENWCTTAMLYAIRLQGLLSLVWLQGGEINYSVTMTASQKGRPLLGRTWMERTCHRTWPSPQSCRNNQTVWDWAELSPSVLHNTSTSTFVNEELKEPKSKKQSLLGTPIVDTPTEWWPNSEFCWPNPNRILASWPQSIQLDWLLTDSWMCGSPIHIHPSFHGSDKRMSGGLTLLPV